MTWDQLHDEDILFEFRGNRADQLTPGRFYLGVVDGFAEFGVFVEIGDGVTGLLHRSQLNRRLESLDWSVGDEVIVQVDGVRDNGNVDLSWSIRTSAEEFRGEGIDDPNTEGTDETDGTNSSSAPRENEPERAPPTVENTASTVEDETPTVVESPTTPETTSERATIADASEQVGDQVRLEGRITNVRQTSGPTIFEVTDESGVIECAAFEAPGMRAFPEVEENDVVRIEGVVERHRQTIQIEVDGIQTLTDAAAETVAERLEAAVAEQSRPRETSLLVDTEPIASIVEDIEAAATSLRRAAIEGRSIVLRHPSTVDGYVGAAALERAITHAIEAEHEEDRAAARLVTRRPMRDSWYSMGDAFYDVPEDVDANPPMVVLVGAGASEEDLEALELVSLYDIDRLVIDTIEPAMGTQDRAAHVLIPADGDTDRSTVTTVAANLAAVTAPAVRSELFHLPAISYWRSVPESYRRIARDNGYDDETVTQRREAIALVAYYQRYDDKRELVTDLLFDGEQAGELAAHVSRQYREKVETAVEIAAANREEISVTGGRVTLVDVADLHHPREFPPTALLLGELQRRWEPGSDHAILAFATDTCHLTGPAIDFESLVTRLNDAVPNAGVEARRDRITFLAGKRDELRTALVDDFATTFDTPSTRS